MVLRGQVRPGLSPEAVHIAWGDPDAKLATGGGKAATETWIYRQRVNVYEPIDSYFDQGPGHGFGGGEPGRGFLPPYAYGGVGYEGTLRYQPHVRSLDSVRIVEFRGGAVDGDKGAIGLGSDSGHAIALVNPRPTAPLTATRSNHNFPHVAHWKISRPTTRIAARLRPHRGGAREGLRVAARRGGRQSHHYSVRGRVGDPTRVRTAANHGSRAGPAGHAPPSTASANAAHRLGHTRTGHPGRTATRSA